jgi:hypothetical protein
LTRQALEASNDLYRNELRLFRNLFLPLVKLHSKLRVGSRLRRPYERPLTPQQRLCNCLSSAVDRKRPEELKRWRDTLDPFALSDARKSKTATGRGRNHSAIF